MQNFIDAYSWINIRFLLEGLGITIEVSVISIVISFILGTLLGIIRYAKIKYLSAIVGCPIISFSEYFPIEIAKCPITLRATAG